MSDTPKSTVIPDDAEHKDGWFAGFLIRLFNLKPYGNSLYTAKTPGSIRGSSYVLLGVLIYEFFAPFMLVNYYANNTGEVVITTLSIPAVLIACLVAGMVFWLDQSVMVMDTSQSNLSREKAWETLGKTWEQIKLTGTDLANKDYDNMRGSAITAVLSLLEGTWQLVTSIKLMANVWIASRLLIIALAAILTAAGPELFIFKGLIDKRELRQAVIMEAVQQAEELQKAEAQAIEAARLEGTIEAQNLGQAQSLAAAAKKEKQRVQERVDQLEAAVQGLRGQLRELEQDIKSTSNPGKRRRLARDRDPLQQQLEDTQRRLAEAKEELVAAKAQVQQFTTLQVTTADGQRERRDSTEQDVEERRIWMSMLARAEINDLPTDPKTNMKFNVQSGGTVDRLAILDDIRNGRPPRWPDCSDKTKQIVINTFPGVAPSPEDVDEERVMNTAQFYNWLYKIMHIAVILIPLMAVFWKLNYSQDAKLYYSMLEQARNGHPGAIKQFRKKHGEDVFRKLVLPHLAEGDPLLTQARLHEGNAQTEFLTKYGVKLYNKLVVPVAVLTDPDLTAARQGDVDAQRRFRTTYGTEFYDQMVLPVVIENDEWLELARNGDDSAQASFYTKYGRQAFHDYVVPHCLSTPNLVTQFGWDSWSEED